MRCIAQVIDWRGRRTRCSTEATVERNGQPVCDSHREPPKAETT